MERMPLLKKSRCPHNQITGYCLDCERQHADALASRLRAHTKGHAVRHAADSCPDCSLLAAHDALRAGGKQT